VATIFDSLVVALVVGVVKGVVWWGRRWNMRREAVAGEVEAVEVELAEQVTRRVSGAG
jgi:hypothetical protein